MKIDEVNVNKCVLKSILVKKLESVRCPVCRGSWRLCGLVRRV